MRILVCGSRNWQFKGAIEAALREVRFKEDITIIHGAARGADTIAGSIAKTFFFRVEMFPVEKADWRRYGKGAGHRRNQIMIDTNPDVVLAFSENLEHSRGTADTVRRATKIGIQVFVWPETDIWYRIWKKSASSTRYWGLDKSSIV